MDPIKEQIEYLMDKRKEAVWRRSLPHMIKSLDDLMEWLDLLSQEDALVPQASELMYECIRNMFTFLTQVNVVVMDDRPNPFLKDDQ